MNNINILEQTDFSTIPIDHSWSFADKTIKVRHTLLMAIILTQLNLSRNLLLD